MKLVKAKLIRVRWLILKHPSANGRVTQTKICPNKERLAHYLHSSCITRNLHACITLHQNKIYGTHLTAPAITALCQYYSTSN